MSNHAVFTKSDAVVLVVRALVSLAFLLASGNPNQQSLQKFDAVVPRQLRSEVLDLSLELAR